MLKSLISTSVVTVLALVFGIAVIVPLMTDRKGSKSKHTHHVPKEDHSRIPALDFGSILDYTSGDFKVKVSSSSFTHEFIKYSHQPEQGGLFLVDKFKYHELELSGITFSEPLLDVHVYFRNYPFAPLLVELTVPGDDKPGRIFLRSNGDGSFYKKTVGDVLFELDMVVETLYSMIVVYIDKDSWYKYYDVIVDVTKTEDNPAPGYDSYLHDRKFFQPMGVTDFYDGRKRLSGLPTGGDIQNVMVYVSREGRVPLMIRTARAPFYPKTEYISYSYYFSNGDGSWTQYTSNLTKRQLKIKLDEVKGRLVPPQPKKGEKDF
ncbi:signal peptide containing protein [Theileria equi strain WA]|uniref:Signal peptide containing protein n=1 Tax=Theileria equi strain WA TaxID=1537102 RepID=L1LDZ1_THEEQ|nr:signal peptide containing protein [Theileria equi strain WA]EKX73499.1 signal peptide containing protein [Theileria equi strain WA]|eukprot:XP_004832951.1 signal peptide containing protein [Theileria equi strain WA]